MSGAPDQKKESIRLLRRSLQVMGLTFILLAVIIASVALISCFCVEERSPGVRCLLLFISAITMCIAGVYILRSARNYSGSDVENRDLNSES